MKHFTSQFKNKTILVVGDIILDKYIFGKITRMSPEAPKTPVILAMSEGYALGGAANVAHNIVSLGGKAILLGYVGKNGNAATVKRLLSKTKIKDASFVSADHPTVTKTRIFDGARQVARTDEESTAPLSKQELATFLAAIKKVQKNIDIVVVADYAKGMVSKEAMTLLVKKFGGDKIIADPKPVHKDLMRNLLLITPNLKELSLMTGRDIKQTSDIYSATQGLAQDLHTSILATLSGKGMALYDKSDDTIFRVPPPGVKVVDVTGAGDVATAACALAIASGASLAEAALFANRAAGISVTKPGTATVTVKEIAQS
jgi:D-beta-D-heptose 7-phosphate kinase/D-beta-D-heptose 1-phosphate adenosyltransferase